VLISRARDFSGRFARDEGGAVIILVGLVIIVLALFAGVAFDSARGYLLKSKLSGALDAAGLAGGRVMTLSDAERDADINAYFAANFPPGFMGATTPALEINENAEGDTLTVEATATVGTTLMRLIGFDDMTVAARAVIKRQVRGLEVVMVLDNTGSMCSPCSKLEDMRDAATTLVNILYGADETIPNLWVGLVPFVHSVNVGNQHTDWLVQAPLTGGVPPSLPHVDQTVCTTSNDHIVPGAYTYCQQHLADPATYGWDGSDPTLPFYHPNYYVSSPAISYGPANIAWKGCVEARLRPDDGSDITDDPPSVRLFRPHFYPETRLDDASSSGVVDNAWTAFSHNDTAASNGRGPNIGCGQAIQPLTAAKTTIQTAIDAMQTWSYGGTAIKHGMAWGWRTLSPRWAGLWDGDPAKPLAYDAPLMDKAMIVLTDGEQVCWNRKNFHGTDPGDYTSHGRHAWGRLHSNYNAGSPITSTSGCEGELDNRLVTLCSNVKATGIKVYTIMVEVVSGSLETMFRNCATKPEWFFEAPSSSDLQDIFETIANDLAQLRIAE
jgi:Flp pilus assembly protein TadG